jgi:hypothetical protein
MKYNFAFHVLFTAIVRVEADAGTEEEALEIVDARLKELDCLENPIFAEPHAPEIHITEMSIRDGWNLLEVNGEAIDYFSADGATGWDAIREEIYPDYRD